MTIIALHRECGMTGAKYDTQNPNGHRTGLAHRLASIRWDNMRLSRREFERRFGIPVGVLQDCEQMRGTPTRATRVLIEAIALDPKLIERAAENAKRWPAQGNAGIP
jgi:DNA-binding transcriptional regulator YiaG